MFTWQVISIEVWALHELTHRKIQVPEQVAITGCNANPEALYAPSPITTIVIPFSNQASVAMDLLFKLLENKKIPMNTIIPAKLFIAQSCGCQSSAVERAAVHNLTLKQKEKKYKHSNKGC